MDKPKLISLKDAIKNASKNLFDNASLGFLFKSYITLSVVMMGIMFIIMVPGFIISGISAKKSDMGTFNATSNVSLEGYVVPESSSESIIPTGGTSEISRMDQVSTQSGTAIIIYGIFAVVTGFALMVITVTYAVLIPIKIHQNNLISIKELLSEALKKTPKFVLLSLPMGFLIGLGYLLFIVPGVILTLMFLFAPYILLTEDVGVVEALKRSKELTKGYRWNLYKKGLGYSLLMLVCLIPLMFLMYATQGLVVCLLTAFTPLVILKIFEDLASKQQEVKNEEIPKEPENDGSNDGVSEEIPSEKAPKILEGNEEHILGFKNMELDAESGGQPEIELENLEESGVPLSTTDSVKINEPEQFPISVGLTPETPNEVENNEDDTETQSEESPVNAEAEAEPEIDIPNPVTIGSVETTEPKKTEALEEEKDEVNTPTISVEEPPVNNFATPKENQENQAEKTEEQP